LDPRLELVSKGEAKEEVHEHEIAVVYA
jgi:hypothetical protein